jgi:uncharacterized protein (TIGR03905 family)
MSIIKEKFTMEHIKYMPQNVCTRQIDITLNGEIIENVRFTGGCPGNTIGISHLVAGLPVKDVIAKLDGIKCIFRGTSCPDQLAKALFQHIKLSEVKNNGN